MTTQRVWILSARACKSDFNQGRWDLQINLLEPAQVLPILRALQKASEDLKWFMSDEGFVLSEIPRKFFDSKIPLAFFYVRWLAKSSQGTVFLLSCPKKEDSLWTLASPEKDSTSQCVVVKVVRELDHLEAEIAALSAMTDAIADNDNSVVKALWQSFQFYALAAIVPKVKTVPSRLVTFKTTKSDYRLRDESEWKISQTTSWWNRQHECAAGAIIMNQGTACDEVSSNEIMSGVCRSLFALHQSGYVHRDIRLPNILKFGDHVQLIDYGFACKKGEQSSQGLFDAMVQRAGPVFQQLHGRYGNSLQWHRTTDHEMLMRVLINREMK